MADAEGPGWVGADEAASIIADAEQAADRIRRRPDDGLDYGGA